MSKKFNLAAIDIDGTLIHGSHEISDANLRAIERMQAAGIEVVLASGRHHVSMRRFAEKIPGIRWMVSSQGAEVSDVSRSNRVEQIFLKPEVTQKAIDVGRSLGFAIVVYSNEDVFRLDDVQSIEPYAGLDGGRIRRLTDEQCAAMQLFKVMWVGEEAHMKGIEFLPHVAALDASQVRTHHYLYELLPNTVTKGTGTARLAAHLGISAEQTVVFGDAENDIPMFKWAGTSVAMHDSWPAALAAATHIAPAGPGSTALARAVDLVLGK